MAQQPDSSGRADVLTDLDDLAGSIRLSVFRMARMLRQQDRHELSAPMTTALLTIGRHGPMSLSELAATERISAPTASKIVDKLEQRGSVTRVADEHDRRAVRIAVTPEGQAEVEEIRSRRTAVIRRAIEALPPEVRADVPLAASVLESLMATACRIVDEEAQR